MALRQYNADIGTWENGRVIEFEAEDRLNALDVANVALHGNKRGEYVVQIRTGKRGGLGEQVVYDYINGFKIYRSEGL